MPELPEVETAKNKITPHILGKKIIAVSRNRAGLRLPFFTEDLVDKTITKITRRSKYILVHFDEDFLLLHLGMSGNLYATSEYVPKKHDHLLLHFDDCELVLNDPRRFGLALYYRLPDECELLTSLGIEPLTDEFDVNYLHQLLQASQKPIKNLIMDSHKIVGIGNIYAAESLYLSGISPIRAANSLTKTDCKKLAANIKKVLLSAIASGGSSIRDYEGGYFQHHFAVYGKENQPCEACNSSIVRIIQAGRSSFYCKQCQK
jgi:formamidopyrimidine-DNA glycosylase